MYVCLFVGAPRIDRDFRQLSSEPSSVVHWPGGRGRPDHGLGHGFAIGGCLEMVAITCVLVAAVFVPYTRAPEMAGGKLRFMLLSLFPLRMNVTVHTCILVCTSYLRIYIHEFNSKQPCNVHADISFL